MRFSGKRPTLHIRLIITVCCESCLPLCNSLPLPTVSFSHPTDDGSSYGWRALAPRSVVLGDARCHAVVDSGHIIDERFSSVSDDHTLTALLQLPCSLCQVSGQQELLGCSRVRTNADLAVTVLATSDHVSLLRTVFSRSPLPHILPSKIRPASRRIFGSVTCPFLVATRLCHGKFNIHVVRRLYAIPRPTTLFNPRVHLVSTQPRYSTELSRPSRIYCAVPPVGPYGIQSGYARDNSKRRDHGCRHRAHLVFLQRRLPTAS